MTIKVNDGRELNIVEISWEEVNNLLSPILPNLIKVMESVDNDKFKFFKASYPFGTRIIKQGKCYLPLKTGESIALNDANLPELIAKHFNYDPESEDPFGIIVNKNSEFYLQTGSRIMSH